MVQFYCRCVALPQWQQAMSGGRDECHSVVVLSRCSNTTVTESALRGQCGDDSRGLVLLSRCSATTVTESAGTVQWADDCHVTM